MLSWQDSPPRSLNIADFTGDPLGINVLIMGLQHTSGNKKAEEDANKDAETKIKEIKEAGKTGQDKVVENLLKAVFEITPIVPERIEKPK